VSRLDTPPVEQFSERQREVHDTIASGPRGAVRGPLGVWLWQPELAQRAQSLGQYCRYDSSLSSKLSEFAILMTGKHWGSEYEWQQHKKFALDAGITPEIIDSLRTGSELHTQDPQLLIVHRFTTELLNTRKVSQPTYVHAIEILGHETVVDLVGLLGYYTLISMTINVFEVDAPGPAELT
jgi:4-carboxymuconolactone decarboxylase